MHAIRKTLRRWTTALLVGVTVGCCCALASGAGTDAPRAQAVQPAQIDVPVIGPTSPTSPSTPTAPPAPRAAKSSAKAEADAEAQRLRQLAERLASKPAKPATATPTVREPAAAPPEPVAPSAARGAVNAPDAAKPLSLRSGAASAKEDLPLGTRPQTSTDEQGQSAAADPSLQSGWVWNTVSALGVVIGLVLVLRLLLTRASGTTSVRSSGVMEVLSRTSVSPRSQMLLVRVGPRVLVLSDGPQGLRTLADIQEPEQVAELLTAVSAQRPASISQGFAQMVSAFNGQYREGQGDEGADHGEAQVDRARDRVGLLLARVRAMSKGSGA